MMRLALFSLLAAALLACSSEKGEQVGASAVMGSALGIPGGPIGIAAGGAAGAVVGALLPEGAFEPSGQSGDQSPEANKPVRPQN
jgi:hypothetical protein